MKVSARAAAQDARRAEKEALRATGAKHVSAVAHDSFVNFAHKLGVGADNILSSGTYGFNPISRNRTLLEWIHRGSWLGGLAVDLVADDMTRAGVEYLTEMPPDQSQQMDMAAAQLGLWHELNQVVKWGRLYGGAISVLLIDGQDPRTPLRVDTIGPGQFKGLLTLDRWQVEPSLNDLVTELGPHLGLPRYYKVQANAPALRGLPIHYSRIVVRAVGVDLPYQQRLTENLWGISVLERLYDRMIGYDTASTGVSQLVGKAAMRTLSVKDLRSVVAAGGKPLEGLMAYTDMMRRFQGIEGITLIDGEDKFEVQTHGAFSGIGDVLLQLGQQLSGALQIPLVRLFGQSPAGLSATGESDLRTYYDNVSKEQARTLYTGVSKLYRVLARSLGVPVPPGFNIGFTSLWDLSDEEKATVANNTADAITKAYGEGLITQQVAMMELRDSSRTTGIFSNISSEDIEAADDQVAPPPGEGLLADMGFGNLNNLGAPTPPGNQPPAGTPIQRKPLPQANPVTKRPVTAE